ncbi:MAG: hypothetical protein FJZ98_04770 [Chloroflexi bacterium]|nr:hypothetical protein [Chloroflexota bacterium]
MHGYAPFARIPGAVADAQGQCVRSGSQTAPVPWIGLGGLARPTSEERPAGSEFPGGDAAGGVGQAEGHGQGLAMSRAV